MATTKKKDYAIVVGINKYPDSDDYDDLRGAVNDAKDFVKWLRSPTGGNITDPDNVIVHVSKRRAARGAVYESIGKLIATVDKKPGRRLYLYLAGHGVGEKEDVDSTMLLAADHQKYEMDATLPGKYFADVFYKKALFEEVILFMDCCRDHGEGLTDSHRPYPVDVDAEAGKVKRCYGYGAKFNRQSHEKMIGKKYHGIFSWAIMRGLRERAVGPDGKVTAQTLEDYVKLKMRYDLNATQEPEFSADPDVVLADDLEPATTQVVIKLKKPTKGFEIIDGKDPTRIYNVKRTRLPDNRWKVHLSPCRLYVIVAQDNEGKNAPGEPFLLLDEKKNVAL